MGVLRSLLFGELVLFLSAYLLNVSPATAAAPTQQPKLDTYAPKIQLHHLSKDSVNLVKSAPSRPSSQPLAEAFWCDPYCVSVGQIYAADPKQYQDGLRVMGTIPDSKDPEDADKLRIVVNPIIAKKPSEKPAKEDESKDKKISDSPIYIGVGLDALLSGRSLSTSANTDNESDAKTHPTVGIVINFEGREITSFKGGSLGARLELSYLYGIGETTKVSTGAGRSPTTGIADIVPALLWSRKGSRWRFGLLLDATYRNYSTNQNTGTDFSTTSLFFSPGVEANYKHTRIQIIKSIFSNIQDSSNYRGSEVSGGLLQINAKSCLPFADVASATLSACAIGSLNLLSYTGAGLPSDSVYTSSPSYNYTEWRFGAEFSLTEFSL